MPSHCAEMIRYSFYQDWLGHCCCYCIFKTIELQPLSKNSSWKMLCNHKWGRVNGIARWYMLLVGEQYWPLFCFANSPKSLIFQQQMEVSCMFFYLCSSEVCCGIHYQVNFLGWLITGQIQIHDMQLFQIFVWQAATQQQLL